jgi:hypothetical protein
MTIVWIVIAYVAGVATAPLAKKLWNLAFNKGSEEIDKLN